MVHTPTDGDHNRVAHERVSGVGVGDFLRLSVAVVAF